MAGPPLKGTALHHSRIDGEEADGMAHMSSIMTTYNRATGPDYHAVQLTWQQVRDILGRDHDGSPEDDETLVQALLEMGAPGWVTDADGWIDENGWGLIGPERTTYQVLEDGGGTLYLAVFDSNEDIVFFSGGFEHDAKNLRSSIEAVENGDDTSGWDTNGMGQEQMQEAYDSLTAHEHGWAVVADDEGIYYGRMGRAALEAFGVED